MFRRRAWTLIAAVALSLALVDGAHASEPARLVDTPSRSAEALQRAPGCAVAVLVCIGGTVAGAVGGALGDAVSTGVGTVGSSVMGGVVSWAAEGAAWLVGEIALQVERSSRPELTSGWFVDRYAAMAQLAAALSALFLLLAVGEAILAQSAAKLLRATFLTLPYALLLTAAAVTLVEIGLALTDAMTAWTLNGTRGEVRDAFRALGTVLAAAPTTGMAPFAVFLGSLAISLLALLVWLELVMREAAIYVAVAFLPLTLVAMVWERTAHWIRRLAELLVALVLAKFTIAVAFSLAASAITGAPGSGGGLSALLAGCAVLLVAALTPWALLRMLPHAEAAAGRTLTRGSVRGAATTVPGVASAAAATRLLLLSRIGSPGTARASAAGTTHAATPPSAAASDSSPTLPTLPRRDAPRSLG